MRTAYSASLVRARRPILWPSPDVEVFCLSGHRILWDSAESCFKSNLDKWEEIQTDHKEIKTATNGPSDVAAKSIKFLHIASNRVKVPGYKSGQVVKETNTQNTKRKTLVEKSQLHAVFFCFVFWF